MHNSQKGERMAWFMSSMGWRDDYGEDAQSSSFMRVLDQHGYLCRAIGWKDLRR
jgi:hypothetical protein